MAPYLLVGRGFGSEVAIRRGDAADGVEGLRSSLQKLHAAPYELLSTELNLSLAGGLAAIGQVDEAIALIDESLGQVETNGNQLYLPELLRKKASLLLQLPESNRNEARARLMQALELSRGQGRGRGAAKRNRHGDADDRRRRNRQRPRAVAAGIRAIRGRPGYGGLKAAARLLARLR